MLFRWLAYDDYNSLLYKWDKINMNTYTYIIVGGGITAGHAAEIFAQHNDYQEGELAIISADAALPYDRTQLSKDYLDGDASRRDIKMNGVQYYVENGIDVYLDTKVTAIDPHQNIIRTDTGAEYTYGKLLLATGSSPHTFQNADDSLHGVHYLRNLAQSTDIREQLASPHVRDVVVAGGGYIGMEVAAVAAQEGKNVTIVFPDEHVMQHRFFTEDMSHYFEAIYRKHGVVLANNRKVTGFEGDDGRVQVVNLDNGERLIADLVIAGLGASPNTALAEHIGLTIAEDGGIQVDANLQTSHPHIYAAGDIASYPDTRYDKRLRIPHWQMAVDQGEYWAHYMLGDTDDTFDSIPYFFSDMFDISYEFWGHPDDADTIVHRGNVMSGSFSTWWLKDERVQAVFAMNTDDDVRTMAQEMIASQNEIDPVIVENYEMPVYAIE